MELKFFLLGNLFEQPLHGYQMKSPWFHNIFKEFGINNNQLYPTLKKMVEENLIKKELVIQDGKPNKYIYFITKKGRSLFLEWLTSSEGEEQSYRYESFISDKFMMRINYSFYLNSDECLEKIIKQIQYVKDVIIDLQEARKCMIKKNLRPVRVKLVEYGILTQETRLKWLKQLLTVASSALRFTF